MGAYLYTFSQGEPSVALKVSRTGSDGSDLSDGADKADGSDVGSVGSRGLRVINNNYYFYIMNKAIEQLQGALYGLIVCTIITMCSGCKTKKAIMTNAHKRTYDSVAVVKEQTHTTFSIIDTTKTSEHSKTITEYTFCSVESGELSVERGGCGVAHLTNKASKTLFIPMVVRKSDGTLQINYGLKGIKQTTEESKDEQKGIIQSKDSATYKDNKTKVLATEEDKHKDKKIERVQVSKPFDWWQLIVGVTILLAVVIGLLYLNRRTPWVRKIFAYVRKY